MTRIRKFFVRQWRLRYFLHRHGQLLAYLVVAAASFYSLHLGLDNADNDREALADSARRAIRVSCEADARNAKALRQALEGNIRFVRAANEPPPPTVEQRVAQLHKLISSIDVPNCDRRVAQITDEG